MKRFRFPGTASALFVLLACFWVRPAGAGTASPAHQRINEALGLPLFADENLWDDDASEIGKRLGWLEGSHSQVGLSHRIYTGESVRVCGARPFSLAFYGRENRPTMFSAIFANKGDVVFEYMRANPTGIPSTFREQQRLFAKIEAKVEKQFRETLKTDEAALVAALTALLGEPRRETVGQSRDLRARVSRWDWNGHAFIVAAPREEYVSMKILRVAEADADHPERRTDQVLKSAFASRVIRRPNGDVMIGSIPMVDQGPKGFCVPATWERYLRYVGIDADMYELAMAGKTGFGGGTFPSEMRESIDDLVARSGCRLKMAGTRPDIDLVAKYVDSGVPLMWEMSVVPDLDKNLSFRAKQRAEAGDSKIWNEVLKNARKESRDLKVPKDVGHMCMIIGYNRATGEIAMSDSWGPEFAERWITVEEASAITLGDLTAITW